MQTEEDSPKKKRRHRTDKEREERAKDKERKHRSRSKHRSTGEADPSHSSPSKEGREGSRSASPRKHRHHRRSHRQDKEKGSPESIKIASDIQSLNTPSPGLEPPSTASTQDIADTPQSPRFDVPAEETIVDEDREVRRERRHREREHRRARRKLQQEEDAAAERQKEYRYYPLADHVRHPDLLAQLLVHLSFPEFFALWSTSKLLGKILDDTFELREAVMERYLGSVGYRRWRFEERRAPVDVYVMVRVFASGDVL